MRRHQQTRHPVLDHLPAAPDVGGDDGQPHGRSFHGRAREALAVRRQHVHVECGIEVFDVAPVPQETDAGRFRRGQRLGPDAIRFLWLVWSRHDDGHLGTAPAQLLGRREELAVALLPHQAPDRTHDDGVVVHAQLGSDARAGRPGLWTGREALQVDAVAEQVETVRGHAQRGERGQVLLVLDQLGVRARGGQALHPVDGNPTDQGVISGGVEAVDGVDHDRHPGRPAAQPPVDAGLWSMRVHNVGPQFAQQPVQLRRCPHVVEDRHAPGGMAQGDMADARALQFGHEGAGCGDADHVIAGGRERGQLGPEQQGQGHVRRGDVDQQGLPQVVAPAKRRRLTRRRRSSSIRIPPPTLRSK